MTIAIALKVHDGMVLAADSASTIAIKDTDGKDVIAHVYPCANKIFNLIKELPVGAMTWGAGSVGFASISTLAKDLRKLLSSESLDWHVNRDNYTIEQIALKAQKFLRESLAKHSPDGVPDTLGFAACGYSSNRDLAEVWEIEVQEATVKDPVVAVSHDDPIASIYAKGQPEFINRTMSGYPSGLETALLEKGVSPDDIPDWIQTVKDHSRVALISEPMPIQDTIAVAKFLCTGTAKFVKFQPGWTTVGGPIEIAAITKHEGFKWINRKHYYNTELNPK